MALIYTEEEFFGENEQVRLGKFLEHKKINMHSHEFWEISYVNEGKGTHYFEDGTTTQIKPDEFLFVSPGKAHCIMSPPREHSDWVRVTNLLMKREFIDGLKGDLLRIDELKDYALRNMIIESEPFCLLLKDDNGIISSYLAAAMHEYKYYSAASGILLRNIVLSILIYIIRLYEGGVREEKMVDTKENLIDDLMGFIQANFRDNLTLDYLAAYMHLSPAYLSRHFKNRTGMKLSDFIIKTRIDYAKKLLKSSNASIQDISAKCGYNDFSNFQKAFKKQTEMSAGEYRQKHR